MIDPNTFLLAFALFIVIFLWIGTQLSRFRLHIGDWWRLRFQRSKVVSCRFQMPSGAIDNRFLIPNERSFFDLPHGLYKFDPKLSVRNVQYGIPEIDLIYQQTAPKDKNLILLEEEIEIEVPSPDGTLVKEMRKVPTYVIKSIGLRPELLKVPKERDWKNKKAVEVNFVSVTASEVKEMWEMAVAKAAILATKMNANKQELIMYLAMAIAVICIIGFMVQYNQLKDLSAQVGTLKTLVQSGGIVHG